MLKHQQLGRRVEHFLVCCDIWILVSVWCKEHDGMLPYLFQAAGVVVMAMSMSVWPQCTRPLMAASSMSQSSNHLVSSVHRMQMAFVVIRSQSSRAPLGVLQWESHIVSSTQRQESLKIKVSLTSEVFLIKCPVGAHFSGVGWSRSCFVPVQTELLCTAVGTFMAKAFILILHNCQLKAALYMNIRSVMC